MAKFVELLSDLEKHTKGNLENAKQLVRKNLRHGPSSCPVVVVVNTAFRKLKEGSVDWKTTEFEDRLLEASSVRGAVVQKPLNVNAQLILIPLVKNVFKSLF